MKTAGFVAIILWSLLSMGQEVHVTQGKGAVELSVSAQKPYQLMSGERKVPILRCGLHPERKEVSHLLKFLPGGFLVEDGSDISAKSRDLFSHHDKRRQAGNRMESSDAIDLSLFRQD